MEVKRINSKYCIDNKVIISANTAMDKNGNKHWKLFLKNGIYSNLELKQVSILKLVKVMEKMQNIWMI